MKFTSTWSTLALGLIVSFASANATSPMRPHKMTYSGSTDCASAKAFTVGRGRFYLANVDCSIVVETTLERQDQFGDNFGSFTFEVSGIGRAPASYNFSESGTYWSSARTGRIHFDFGGRDYPRPGRSYSFGEFQRRGLVLATSVRGGTLLVRH